MTPFISNQLHKLHCEKSKNKKTSGIYLKFSITVHVFSPALENQTGKMHLFVQLWVLSASQQQKFATTLSKAVTQQEKMLFIQPYRCGTLVQ